MKKCLLLFWHGIGDLINLTPALRELHKHGYHTDILVKKMVADSGLLDACPYADLIPLDIHSVSAGGVNGAKDKKTALDAFNSRKGAYDGHWIFRTDCWKVRGALMALYYEETVKAMRLKTSVNINSPTAVYGPPAVWIPKECELEAERFVADNYPNGFIFKRTGSQRGPDRKRTSSGSHPGHHWYDADKWIKQNLPPLPIFDQDARDEWSNINTLFAIAKKASHRVLYSSVMIHACEAMGATMDIVNYGNEASKHWPEDPNIIKVIRRKESRTAKYSFNGGRTWVTGI